MQHDNDETLQSLYNKLLKSFNIAISALENVRDLGEYEGKGIAREALKEIEENGG